MHKRCFVVLYVMSKDLYIPVVVLSHCEKKASRINLDNKETDQSRYMHTDKVSKF